MGLAGTTRSAAPNSMSEGSCCSAALKNARQAEHDDELGRRVELAPVGLAGEPRQVIAGTSRVLREARRPGFGVGIDRVEIGNERRLSRRRRSACRRGASRSSPAGIGLPLTSPCAARGSRSAPACPRARRRVSAAAAPVSAHVRLTQSLHELAGLAVQRSPGRRQASGSARRASRCLSRDPSRPARASSPLAGAFRAASPAPKSTAAACRDPRTARVCISPSVCAATQHRVRVCCSASRPAHETRPSALFGALQERVAIGRGSEVALEPRLVGGQCRGVGLQAGDLLVASPPKRQADRRRLRLAGRASAAASRAPCAAVVSARWRPPAARIRSQATSALTMAATAVVRDQRRGQPIVSACREPMYSSHDYFDAAIALTSISFLPSFSASSPVASTCCATNSSSRLLFSLV